MTNIEKYCLETARYFQQGRIRTAQFTFVRDMPVVQLQQKPCQRQMTAEERMTSPESLAMLAEIEGITVYRGTDSGSWDLLGGE